MTDPFTGSYFGPCPRCHGEGCIERLATPEEVDAGCELGIAFDDCDECGGCGGVERSMS